MNEVLSIFLVGVFTGLILAIVLNLLGHALGKIISMATKK